MTDDWEHVIAEELPVLVALARDANLEELEVGDERRTVRLRFSTDSVGHGPLRDSAVVGDDDLAREPAARAQHVGVFHRGPEGDSGPVVEPGAVIAKGAAVGFVDVLGVFHEVSAPCDGIIEAIVVSDGDPVEYGQPVALITPNR